MVLRSYIAAFAVSVAFSASSSVLAEDQRTGTIVGVIKSKKDVNDGKNTNIEVLAPGEEKPRSYHVIYDQRGKGPMPDVLRAVRAAGVGDRVEFDWSATGHGPAITKFKVVKSAGGDDKKNEKRGGTVTGVVSAKGENWIEVKGDGEEKGRKYVPHWRGGNPADGGGLDKKMLAEIKAVPVKSRVRLEWTFEERPRVEKIEVLKKPESEKKK
jgi:hypothetical protein